MTAFSRTATVRKAMLALLAAGALGYGVVAWSAGSPSHAQATLSAGIENKDVFDPKALSTFYEERGMRPVWWRGAGNFQPRVDAVLSLLDAAWMHGLNPETYHVTRLRDMIRDPGMNRFEFDMLLSDAVIRYTRDLTGMRGLKADVERERKYWREPMATGDILQKVVLSANPVRQMRDLAPGGTLYLALQKELVALTADAGQRHDALKLPAGLKPGKSHAEIPALRARLGLPLSESTLYDDNLAAAVMKLQRRSALKADGVLRADTIAALNGGEKARIRQVLANMERLRWMEQARPGRYVLVNIPSTSLWAVEGGKVALEMPVIVGKTARPTYSFRTEITGVRFNPNWTVPPTIKKKDFLPMLQQDPEAFLKRGITIRYGKEEVDPTKVDWSRVTTRGMTNLKLVQNPGDDNPLGKVRIIMENPYDIYLHDTNNRGLFDQDERTLSSGCIRVAQPEKLADFILRQNKDWSWNRMESIINSGKMRDVKNDVKLPVYITYQTMWLDSEGGLVYGPDIYGQDDVLVKKLEKTGGIHIPGIIQDKEISL